MRESSWTCGVTSSRLVAKGRKAKRKTKKEARRKPKREATKHM